MATPADPPPPRFRIDASGEVRDMLRKCQAEAKAAGCGVAFLAAVTDIYNRLATSADTLGEAFFDLPDARLQVRKVVLGPAVVEFGIHYRDPIVIIRAFRLIPPTLAG